MSAGGCCSTAPRPSGKNSRSISHSTVSNPTLQCFSRANWQAEAAAATGSFDPNAALFQIGHPYNHRAMLHSRASMMLGAGQRRTPLLMTPSLWGRLPAGPFPNPARYAVYYGSRARIARVGTILLHGKE